MDDDHDDANLTRPPTRRMVLGGLGAALLAGACSSSSDAEPPPAAKPVAGGAGPELTKLRIGMIALTDCSPFVIAREKGFFAKHGLDVAIVKGASWAAIRDSLTSGDLHATHMLTGMPIASTMGLGGSPKVPMIIPWLANRNGQAITMKKAYEGKVGLDPKGLLPFVEEARQKGSPLTFAMTFPPGTHAMWMRYYLGAGGVNPDKDVTLITIPPPQMISNMKLGKMDGFCVGEPWGARALADGVGFTAIKTEQIWRDHPEKVCAFTRAFADKHPKTVKAVLKALHEASVWLDDMPNRAEQAKIVSATTYINCPPETILERLQDPEGMIFSRRNCNYPQKKYAKWFLSQYRRWGLVEGTPDYDGIADQVMRPDLYEEAMKELGVAHGGASDAPETLFDGVTFDPAKPEEYALGFAVNNVRG